MSVNEVKTKQAVEAFAVKGTGPPSARTFCIGNEDHTLGNSLRHVLIQNSNVTFAGYSVPHPAEPVVQLRVQTVPESTAATELKTACQTLMDQCDIVLHKLEEKLPHVRDDRIEIEAFLDEMAQEDEEDEEEDDDDNGMEE